MRIIFVRHGHPNYEKNCLTELGHLQAEAAAERLSHETVEAIYASSYGRAVETAAHIAAKHDLSVNIRDFICELHWGSVDDQPIFQNGHPWFIADDMIARGISLMDPNWGETERYNRNILVSHVKLVEEGIDEWLSELGYSREGNYYRVTRENDNNVVLVSHAGSSGAALAHILNLPFPFVCAVLSPDFTGISILKFTGKEGELICPRAELLSDARHIEGIQTETVFEQ